jgi:hypothetical protein
VINIPFDDKVLISWSHRMASRIQSIPPVLSKEKAQEMSMPEFLDPREHRQVANSPANMTPREEANEPITSSPSTSGEEATAPARLQASPKELEHSIKEKLKTAPGKLERANSPTISQAAPDTPEPEWSSQPGSVMEPEGEGKKAEQKEKEVAVQTLNFQVQWLCTERLPFYKIRHIRNPWNFDREVKISRDGTELDPAVGKQLLDEWRKLAESPLQ